MSWFGGPNDHGVGPDEGLALVNKSNFRRLKHYFLPKQPPGTTGLARRLNPHTFYIACRWDYHQTSPTYLVNHFVWVKNPKNKRTALAKPVDWGPNADTGRVADLSLGLLRFLGLQTDDTVEVTDA